MELIKLLPDYYENNETMRSLQNIVSEETDALEEKLEYVVRQCFVETADELLTRYERMLGITPDAVKSLRYRRERLKAKLFGAETTTKTLVEHISQSYVGAEVEVVERPEEAAVVFRFVGTVGIPGNIRDIKESIEEIIPAHLKVEYEYVYNTYGAVGTFTYGELKGYTHYEVRNGRVKSRILKLQKYQHVELGQLPHIRLSKGDLPNGG